MPASAPPNIPETPSPPDSEPAPRKSGRAHVLAYIGNRFFAGLAVAIPLIVTLWMLVLSYRFILFVGRPVIETVFHGINLALDRTAAADNLITPPEWFLNLFGILTPLVLFIALGVMATNVLGAKIISIVDRLVLKFPVISFIYSGLKQVMDSFRNFGAGRNFQRVAYVDYPAPGCRLLGFVTGQYHDAQIGKDVTSIFIPTSPNPMTGFVIVVEDDKVFGSSLSIEQATKLILSAGLVAPDFNLPPSGDATKSTAPEGPKAEIQPEAEEAVAAAKAAVPDRPATVTIRDTPPASRTEQPRPGKRETSRRGERFAINGPGKDPVVLHEENAAAPGSGSFDGLTGFEEDEL